MKRLLILCFAFLLMGCAATKEAYCEKKENDHITSIGIKAVNDRIDVINIEESFKLPASLLQDEKMLSDFLASIHDDYEIRDGNLVLKKTVFGNYSYSVTIDELSKDYFYCSCSINR